MATIITVTNQKGGVGKTTTTAAFASIWKHRQKKVLVVDLDPQGNLSFCLGANNEQNATTYDVLKGEIKTRFAIQHCNGIDVIPTNILLSGIELQFTSVGREYLLKKALESVVDFYDYIIIDTPPSLGILTVNALVASNYVIVPSLADIFSLQGIGQLNDVIEFARIDHNPTLSIAGVIINRYSERILLNREGKGATESILKDYKIPLFKVCVRNSIHIPEAQSKAVDLVTYSPRNAAVRDFNSIISELEKRGI